MSKQTTLGVVVGNRGFFPDHLAETGRQEILQVLEKEGLKAVALTPADTKFGSVETRDDAKKCAALFKQHSDEIDGILVTLPNFGEESGIAEAIRMAGLNVPVLIQATPDDAGKMTLKDRRDSFCGKLSVCNNLTQYGIGYSLTNSHTVAPTSAEFAGDLATFAATCRVVRGLTNARFGAIGARPAAFKTVRYSEKILEANGISVEVVDLYEIMGRVDKIDVAAAGVQAKLAEIRGYLPTSHIPEAPLMRMAKFGAIVDEWIAENDIDATAIQCWTAIEEFFGIVPCTVMSMMSNKLIPSACEVDITGAIGMYALALASGVPAALLDWNNNYGNDPDKCVLFHCSNLPTGCMCSATMHFQDIIAGTVGVENSYGAVVGRIKPGAFTYARVSTDDLIGEMRAYVGEGEFTDDALDTFGGAGVACIPNLQGLLRHMCETGFEHHTAIAHAAVGDALADAMGNYLGWEVYHHIG